MGSGSWLVGVSFESFGEGDDQGAEGFDPALGDAAFDEAGLGRGLDLVRDWRRRLDLRDSGLAAVGTLAGFPIPSHFT